MRALLFLTIFGSLAFAQLDDNTITVTATRPVTIQPDQVLIYATVSAAPITTLDDVIAALSGTGISAANLTNAYSFATSPLATQWSFSLPVSFTELSTAVTRLAQLQAGLPASANMELNFYVPGTQVSAAAQAGHPCVFPALLSDARQQADKTAAAAGFKAGALIAIADTPATVARIVAAPTFAVVTGNFTAIQATYTNQWFAGPSTSCSITVQFKLVR